MDLRSFEAWNRAGLRVMKGEHHVARADDGTPLFSRSQVYEPYYGGDMDREDDADFAQAYGLPWGLD